MIAKHRNTIILVAVAAAVLAGAWFFGGNYVKTGSEAAQAPSDDSGFMSSGPGGNAGMPDTGLTAADSGNGEPIGAAASQVPAHSAIGEVPESSGDDSGERDGAGLVMTDSGAENQGSAVQGSAVPGMAGSGATDSASAAGQNTTSSGNAGENHDIAQNEAAPSSAAQSSEGSTYPGDQTGGTSAGVSHTPGTDQQHADAGSSPASATEELPLPLESQDLVADDGSFSVTLSVKCDTLVNNLSMLNKEKHELVPGDGVVFAATLVTAYEDESVFNVFLREMKKARIHMAFRNTPIYNSAYIEAINNIYEFDAGELSGWMYSVNGRYPNYGSSRYQLSPGDVIEWNFTCDLGRDLGQSFTGGWQLDD